MTNEEEDFCIEGTCKYCGNGCCNCPDNRLYLGEGFNICHICSEKFKRRLNFMRENKKAVTVAKDVLKHLKDYKVVSAKGYIKYPNDNFDVDDYFGLCKTEITKKIQKDCEVCALGACLVAAFNTGFAQPTHLLSFLSESFYSGMEQLKTIFGDNYRKIEEAFEAYNYGDDYDRGDNINFGIKFDDDKERLRAILQNIVDNKGNFVPGTEGVNADKYRRVAKRRKR